MTELTKQRKRALELFLRGVPVGTIAVEVSLPVNDVRYTVRGWNRVKDFYILHRNCKNCSAMLAELETKDGRLWGICENKHRTELSTRDCSAWLESKTNGCDWPLMTDKESKKGETAVEKQKTTATDDKIKAGTQTKQEVVITKENPMTPSDKEVSKVEDVTLPTTEEKPIGSEKKPYSAAPVEVSEEKQASIAYDYEAGKSVSTLSALYGFSMAVINRVLRNKGLKTKSESGAIINVNEKHKNPPPTEPVVQKTEYELPTREELHELMGKLGYDYYTGSAITLLFLALAKGSQEYINEAVFCLNTIRKIKERADTQDDTVVES